MALPRGGGFMTIIMPRGYLVSSSSFDFLFFIIKSAVDLKGIDKMHFEFALGKPFRPFEQLMGVLPEASKEHVPSAYRVSSINSRLYRSRFLSFFTRT